MKKKKEIDDVLDIGFSMDQFEKFDAKLSKIKGFENGSILETNKFVETTDWIDTGHAMLNMQLSGRFDGGIANNKSYGLMGDPGSGKSFLCLNILREAQKKGYYAFYCETEGAVDKKTAQNFGIDTKMVRYQPIATVDQFKTFVINMLSQIREIRKTNPRSKFILFLDSLGMLSTSKERQNAMDGHNAQDMGLKAKEIRAMMRVITLDLSAMKVPFIVTNHIYTGGGSFVPTKEWSGGSGALYSLSAVLSLSVAKSKDRKEGVHTGVIVTSTPKKSRFTIPWKIKLHISFTGGMNRFTGLEDEISWERCGIERGKVTKDKDGNITAELKDTSRTFAVKHLNSNVWAKDLFNDKVFTPDIMKELELHVSKKFLLPDVADESELEFMIDAEMGDDDENENGED